VVIKSTLSQPSEPNGEFFSNSFNRRLQKPGFLSLSIFETRCNRFAWFVANPSYRIIICCSLPEVFTVLLLYLPTCWYEIAHLWRCHREWKGLKGCGGTIFNILIF